MNSREIPRKMSVIGVESLADIHAVVLATDGLSEHQIGVQDPAATVAAAVASAAASDPDLRALEASRTVTEAALAAQRANQAGDNIATAVLWLGR